MPRWLGPQRQRAAGGSDGPVMIFAYTYFDIGMLAFQAQLYNNRPQLMAKLERNKKEGFSYALFDPSPGGSTQPVSSFFSFKAHDRHAAQLEEIRKFAARRKLVPEQLEATEGEGPYHHTLCLCHSIPFLCKRYHQTRCCCRFQRCLILSGLTCAATVRRPCSMSQPRAVVLVFHAVPNCLLQCLAAGSTTYRRKIRELGPPAAGSAPDIVDILCRIIALDESSQDECVMYVWDGTDAKPLPCTMNVEPQEYVPPSKR